MEITVEICYYPLITNYNQPIEAYLKTLSEYPHIQIETGTMSSLITGQYEEVMRILNESMRPFLEKYPSVFKLTIASACNSCSHPK